MTWRFLKNSSPVSNDGIAESGRSLYEHGKSRCRYPTPLAVFSCRGPFMPIFKRLKLRVANRPDMKIVKSY
jgi:hypothetical protein